MKGLSKFDIEKIEELKEKMLQATCEKEVRYYASLIHEVLDGVERRLQSVQKSNMFELLTKKKWRLSSN